MPAKIKLTTKTRKVRKTIGRRDEVLIKFFIYINGIEVHSEQQGDYDILYTFMERMEELKNRFLTALKNTDGEVEIIQERLIE